MNVLLDIERVLQQKSSWQLGPRDVTKITPGNRSHARDLWQASGGTDRLTLSREWKSDISGPCQDGEAYRKYGACT